MSSKQFSSNWRQLQESFLTFVLGNIPTKVGGKLRNLLYRNIFAHIGHSVYIQHGVKLFATSCIEIGNGVKILQGVSVNAQGHPKNKVSLGEGVVLEFGVDIRALQDSCISIDERTYIGPYVCMWGPGNIKIGKNCLIAAHTGILANSHVFDEPIRNLEDKCVARQGIIIEDDCWLGHKVTVLDGVTIGKGSVIGAGAVVARDIPPYSVAVGIPARVVKSRLNNSPHSSRTQVQV